MGVGGELRESETSSELLCFLLVGDGRMLNEPQSDIDKPVFSTY